MGSYNVLTAGKYGFFTNFNAPKWGYSGSQTNADQGLYFNGKDGAAFGDSWSPTSLWGNSINLPGKGATVAADFTAPDPNLIQSLSKINLNLGSQNGDPIKALNDLAGKIHLTNPLDQNGDSIQNLHNAINSINLNSDPLKAISDFANEFQLGDPSAPEVQPDANGKKSQKDISNDISKMEAYLKESGGTGAIDGKLTADEIKTAVTNGNLFTGDNKQYWTGVSGRMAFEESQGAANDDNYGHFIVLNKDNYGNYTADAASISTAQAQNNFIAQGADGFS
jgi:hypothetical protein